MSDVIEEIRQIYAEEDRKGVLAQHLSDVPHSYDRLTPQWFTELLCRDTPGAEVTDITLAEASNGSSNRQRILLRYNQAGQDAGLPASVFCKASQSLLNRLMLGAAGTARGETNFFTLVRPRLEIEAPEAIHAAFDSHTRAYIIVMKDMTGKADFLNEMSTMDRANAENLVEVLATLHSAFYESPELGTASLPFHHWTDWWENQMDVAPTFGPKCEAALEECEEIVPARLFARRAEIWPRTNESASIHRTLPRTLIHSDVHVGNWYKHEGRMGLCDWQITTVGHWSRDLIYALSTALTVDDRRLWLDDLLRHYIAVMESRGVPKISFEETHRQVRQQLLSTLAFWTITLRPTDDMPPMQPQGITRELIRRIAAAVDDMDALDAFD